MNRSAELFEKLRTRIDAMRGEDYWVKYGEPWGPTTTIFAKKPKKPKPKFKPSPPSPPAFGELVKRRIVRKPPEVS